MMHPLPIVTQVYNLIKQEEKQRQGYVSSLPHNSTALASISTSFIGTSSKSTPKYYPSQIDHASNANSQSVATKSDLICTHCHLTGHTKNNCYKLVGYLLNHPQNPANRNKNRRRGVYHEVNNYHGGSSHIGGNTYIGGSFKSNSPLHINLLHQKPCS